MCLLLIWDTVLTHTDGHVGTQQSSGESELYICHQFVSLEIPDVCSVLKFLET